MITVYTHNDLIIEAKDKSFEEIEFHDFKYSREALIKADFVIYFESQANFKIIKNRYTIGSENTKEILALLGIRLIG